MSETRKNNQALTIITGLGVGLLGCFFLLIAARIVVKNVFYEKFGIYNGFVAWMLSGDNDLTDVSGDGEGVEESVDFDWSVLYPYDEAELAATKSGGQSGQSSLLSRYKAKIASVESQISWYSSDGIPMQTSLTEAAIAYEQFIGWNVQEEDFDAVITLRNGHLTCICDDESDSIAEITDSITGFRDWLSAREIELVYVMAPFKIDAEDTELPLGLTDSSNANADALLEALTKEGVASVDLRAYEKEDGLDHYGMFYYTDHHWNAGTAVWASGRVARALSELYGYAYDADLWDLANYTSVVYPKVFLGSYGRRVTLSQADPEDFEILYPNFENTYRLTFAGEDLDVSGDFSEVFIAYDRLEITDYYEMDAYSAYITTRPHVATITNPLASNPDTKILILRDSFGNIFAPYFAAQYGTVELLDVSLFTGSVKSYIEESQPDVVLLLYNPTMIEPINWDSITDSKFDFR